MRMIVVALMALAVSACGLRQPVQFGGASGWGSKTVQGKEDPATLVAADASTCVVTVRRYQAVKIGDRVTCRWQRWGGDGPVPGGAPPRSPMP